MIPIFNGSGSTLEPGLEDVPYILKPEDLLGGFKDIEGDSLSVLNHHLHWRDQRQRRQHLDADNPRELLEK